MWLFLGVATHTWRRNTEQMPTRPHVSCPCKDMVWYARTPHGFSNDLRPPPRKRHKYGNSGRGRSPPPPNHRRKPPLLFGRISIHLRSPPEPEEMELEEDPMLEWQEWQPGDDSESQPPPPPPPPPAVEEALQHRTPQRGMVGRRSSLTLSRPPQSPMCIEVCTPTQVMKRQRLHTPIHFFCGPNATT